MKTTLCDFVARLNSALDESSFSVNFFDIEQNEEIVETILARVCVNADETAETEHIELCMGCGHFFHTHLGYEYIDQEPDDDLCEILDVSAAELTRLLLYRIYCDIDCVRIDLYRQQDAQHA